MKRIPILVCVWLSSFYVLFSQEATSQKSIKPVNQSTLVGIGKVFLNDSYLTPVTNVTYEGIAISLMHDRIKGTNKFDGKMLLQNQFRIQTGFTKNPPSSNSEYWGNLYYNLAGFYPLLKTTNFRLYGGGGPEAALGGIYKINSSNNPGSLKASLNLNLSAIAFYNLRHFTFRWQLSTPFIGAFFSPEYGQSLYEMGLGNSKGVVHLGSFHNQRALRSYFTVDIPVHNVTLRTGYLWDYYSTDVNKLVTKINAHQFVLGLAFESLNFAGKKVRNNPVFESAYY